MSSLPSQKTIFALASGALPCAVAVVRISGPQAASTFKLFHVKRPKPRYAQLAVLRDEAGQLLDQALLFWYPAPASFTGEDVVELQLHGSPAVLQALFLVLGRQTGWRMAEPGEFTRRAFENGRMDLTEVEALGDLIAAQTESQRLQALQQYSGALRMLYESWRSRLLKLRAAIEADFDFSDEEDVPGSVAGDISPEAYALAVEIKRHMNDGRKGEIIREGLKVALTGPPNAGKSSLLNALAQRDVAIVTDQPGTTRDIVQTALNLDGQLVLVYDTAGLRETQDIIEAEGIRRAREAASGADVIVWLEPADQPVTCPPDFSNQTDGAGEKAEKTVLHVRSKADLAQKEQRQSPYSGEIWISAKTGEGLGELIKNIKQSASVSIQGSKKASLEQPVLTRTRHRLALHDAVAALDEAAEETLPLEIRVEHLRTASDALGRIVGRIDVEDILGHIFSEFCIGK